MKLKSTISPRPLTCAIQLGLTSVCSALPALALQNSQAHAFPPDVELSALKASEGFKVVGEAADDRLGWVVSGAGDFNGDGLDDLIMLAAPGLEGTKTSTSASKVYLLFGRADGFADIDLSDLGTDDGFEIEGASSIDSSKISLQVGQSVAGVGDINGDGFDDVMIGSPKASPNGSESGQAFVIFGTDQSVSSPFDLASLGSDLRQDGFVINGKSAGMHAGHAVASAGDVNGDGVADIIIGAPGATQDPMQGTQPDGDAYVVFGQPEFDSVIELHDIDEGDGARGFRINGITGSEARSGFAVSSAGDINSDGFDDVIVGVDASFGDTHIVFGRLEDESFGGSVNLADINTSDGEQGFRFTSSIFDSPLNGYDQLLGVSVGKAGDINGDGLSDILIGAPYAVRITNSPLEYDYVGISYVVFGNEAGFPSSIENKDLANGSGFLLQGAGQPERQGGAVAGLGDINGDGIDDFATTSPYSDPNGNNKSGSTYVIFGRESEFTTYADVNSVADGIKGFVLEGDAGYDKSGRSIAGIGDFNGDGVSDFIIGAPEHDGNGADSGAVYVVFGGVTGLGEVPQLSGLPASVDFGVVSVGDQSGTETIVLTNSGSSELSLGDYVLLGSGRDDFSISNDTCTNQTLSIDAECSFDITLSPSVGQLRSAQLSLTSNAPSSPASIILTGQGYGLSAALSVSNLDFGVTQMGTPTDIERIELVNRGSRPIVFESAVLSGRSSEQFEIVEDTCSEQILAVGARCFIDVRSIAAISGNLEASLGLRSNLGSASIDLSAEASNPVPVPAFRPEGLAWLSVLLGLLGWRGLRQHTRAQ